MNSTITLERRTDAWYAVAGGPKGNDIMRLFGTRTLPTAFTPAMDAATVLQEIQRLNPGVIVALANYEML